MNNIPTTNNIDNQNNILDQTTDDNSKQHPLTADCEKELLAELNKIFTPVLIMQGFEKDIADKTKEAMSESSILTEKNMIGFDDNSRMAQLLSVCALLIAKHKNTDNWQIFKKASMEKNQSKLAIQKEEYNDAKTLAQKYLVMVSTTNNSSVARDSASDLLPYTQH